MFLADFYLIWVAYKGFTENENNKINFIVARADSNIVQNFALLTD